MKIKLVEAQVTHLVDRSTNRIHNSTTNEQNKAKQYNTFPYKPETGNDD